MKVGALAGRVSPKWSVRWMTWMCAAVFGWWTGSPVPRVHSPGKEQSGAAETLSALLRYESCIQKERKMRQGKLFVTFFFSWHIDIKFV